jgi:hypothetical protein
MLVRLQGRPAMTQNNVQAPERPSLYTHHRMSPTRCKYLAAELACQAAGGLQQYSGPHAPRSWLTLLALLTVLLLPAAILAEAPAITFLSDGGDVWTFEKGLEGTLPDSGCDEVLVASP